MNELENSVALITGASKGIGAATAREFARQGAKVVLAARSEDSLKTLAEEINSSGGQAIAIACDVADFDNVSKAVELAVKTYGRIDILINNAGLIDPIATIANSDPQEWAKAADVNYKGVYFGLRAAIPKMLEQGKGTIVNVSSGAATGALEGWSHYCSSKAAALSLTKCAHVEYADKGITVVGMSPGTVATGMQISIKASGINPVSQLDPSVHIPAEWPAKAISFLCTERGKDYAGTDFSLKTEEGRRVVGLID
ncbi:SDR family oxidoreductase [Sneathiella glossodoripedis]|uniref:SDR family oxidoreductase n=1 Tax=Sneathiella glossodoripedis TaxID=418853 RepID=UPI0004725A56|nr:SDR family oxidoreductase [Sneathiella glossodoripedis]